MRSIRIVGFAILILAFLGSGVMSLSDLVETHSAIAGGANFGTAVAAFAIWHGLPMVVLAALAWLCARNNFGGGGKNQ